MNIQALASTAHEMVANGKGLLAIDESTGACNKRFAQWAIIQNAETLRQYRELIVNTPGLGESISGAILYDETIRQRKDDGTPFAAALAELGILPGIKVDEVSTRRIITVRFAAGQGLKLIFFVFRERLLNKIRSDMSRRQRVEAGDHVEQLLVDRLLPDAMKGSI